MFTNSSKPQTPKQLDGELWSIGLKPLDLSLFPATPPSQPLRVTADVRFAKTLSHTLSYYIFTNIFVLDKYESYG